jgi:hypothetical protein
MEDSDQGNTINTPELNPGIREQHKKKEESSEYANKPSLLGSVLARKFMKIVVISGGSVLLLFIAVLGYQIYQKWQTTPVSPPPPPPPPPIVEPVSVNKAVFAYLKDRNSIWTIDVNGENKKQIYILKNNTDKLTALDWKAQNKLLSFSLCKANNICEISTYDMETNSLSPEVKDIKSNFIRKLTWSDEKDYLAYVAVSKGNYTETINVKKNAISADFILRSGSVDQSLVKFYTIDDPTNSQTKVLFTPQSRYVILSTLYEELVDQDKNSKTSKKVYNLESYPVIYIFRMNGSIVEIIKNASDPWIENDTTIGYKKDDKLVYKTIGEEEETLISDFEFSYNPVISPNLKQIAYWKKEGGFNDNALGVYEKDLSIHRNIVRGIVLPLWVSENKVLGIKPDGCLGQNCLLYEYQTAVLTLIDVKQQSAQVLDQGKTITEVEINDMNYTGSN